MTWQFHPNSLRAANCAPQPQPRPRPRRRRASEVSVLSARRSIEAAVEFGSRRLADAAARWMIVRASGSATASSSQVRILLERKSHMSVGPLLGWAAPKRVPPYSGTRQSACWG